MALRPADIRRKLSFSADHAHVADKLIRDALFTRGDNKLNPFKNRALRWDWPGVVRSADSAPAGWAETEIEVTKEGGSYHLNARAHGFGSYVTVDQWRVAVESLKEVRALGQGPYGFLKVGIPIEEAATEADCDLIARSLAFQAHRILGRTEAEIGHLAPLCALAVRNFPVLRSPDCPLCHSSMMPEGFIERIDDPNDPFRKEREGRDDAIQLFHIEPLTPGRFSHVPGNVAWGHRRCNVTVGGHSIEETLRWFAEILDRQGRHSSDEAH